MKTILITGASRGIGAACARRFAAAGWQVAVGFCRERARAEALCAELGGNTAAFQADISDRDVVRGMVQAVHARFGAVDALVNNAGIARQQLFSDVSDADFEALCAVNLRGAFLVTQEVLPDLIRKKAGSIVNISSMWGVTGASCEVIYSMTKAGLIGFTRALAKELGPSGITVNAVAPGVIDTEMNAALDSDALNTLREETPLGVIGRPEDIAESVFFLAGDSARFVTGQVLGVNGGFVI